MSGDDLNQLYNQLGFLFCKRQQKEGFPIVTISEVVENLLGYKTEEILRLKNFAKLVHPDDLTKFQKLIQADKPENIPYSLTYSLQHKNGEYVYVQEKGRILKQGKTTYLEGLLTAVQAPERKEKSAFQGDFEPLFHAASEGIIVHHDNIVQIANEAFYEMFGRTPEEVIGKDIVANMPPPLKDPKIDQLLAKLEKDAQLTYQQIFWFYRKDGTRIFVSVTGKPILYKGQKMRCVLFRNVTREIEMHSELENSREKYKAFAEASQEGIIIHDKGVMVEVNPKIGAMLGYSVEELINKPVSMLVLAEEIPKIMQFLRENEQNKALKRQDKIKALHKSGEIIDVAVWGSGIELNGEKLRYIIVRDISEEVKAQKELQSSHQKYKRLSDITEEMILVHDNGIIVEANKATCDFYELSESELIGMHTFDLLPKDIIKQYNLTKETLEAAYKGDSVSNGVHQKEKNGKNIFCQYKETVFYVGGRRLRYVVMRNITDIQETQQQLEESRNKFKLIADATNEAIVIQAIDGTIREVNQNYCNLFLTTPEYIIGKTGMEFVPPEELEQVFNLLLQSQSLITKDNYHELQPMVTTLTLQKSTGERFVAESQANYTVINNELLRYTVIRDMTKIVLAQRLLQESNAKYKRLSDATKEGIIIHRDGIIAEVNQTACKLFGWEEVDLVGRHIQELTSSSNINILNSLQTGSASKIDRILLQKQNGDTFIAEIWESTIMVDGESLRYTVIRDTTERIRYEQRIEELVDDLSEKNKQLNCLFDLARLSSNKAYNIDELLEKTLLIIPKSWQYPEICEVYISFGQKEWQSNHFSKGQHFISAPIICDNQAAGQVKVAYTENCPLADEGPFLYSERALIDALGIQIGTLIEKRLSEDRVVASILETEDRERTRVAKELHDSLGQLLMAISLNLEALKKDMNILSDKSQLKLSNALSYLSQAIQESRQISHNLMPKAISDYGYVLAVQSMLEGISFIENVNFHFYNNLEGERLNPKMELALFRITQEAITNALKHSSAKNITIQLMKYSDVLILTIEDDGIGFNVENSAQQFGLNSIRNRSNSISGISTIESKAGHGTTIMIEVPL